MSVTIGFWPIKAQNGLLLQKGFHYHSAKAAINKVTNSAGGGCHIVFPNEELKLLIPIGALDEPFPLYKKSLFGKWSAFIGQGHKTCVSGKKSCGNFDLF